MKAWAFLLLPALVGCPRSAPVPVAADWDPDSLVEAARNREVPPVVRAGFRMKIDGVDTVIPGGLEGVLILGPDGAFYTEIASTFGPRVMTCASDGQSLALLIPRERLWAGETNGEDRIREASGGLAGLAELGALLVGQLPVLDAPVVFVSRTESGLSYGVEGPSGTSVELEIDARSQMVTQVVFRDADDEVWVRLDHTPGEIAGTAAFPSQSILEVASTGMTMTLTYNDWQVLESSPVSFALPAPEGIEVVALEDLPARLEKP
jgi:hypothetical protein